MFSENYSGGVASSNFGIHGAVILENIIASENYQDNVDPTPDTGGTGITLQAIGNITATNISADGNFGDGINLLSNGNITLNGINASDNYRGRGAFG